MIENEAKGWYGSYSLAGKSSAKKYNNIVRKNEILKGEHKKVKIHDLFRPDEPKIENIEQNIDVFKIYSFNNNTFHKIKQRPKNQIQSLTKLKNEKQYFKYFFHNKHCTSNEKRLKLRIAPEPGCTKYNPNYSYIYPKLLTGPKWEDISGRKQKKIEIDNRDFLINNLENYDKYIINNGDIKCFVNMNKTTQRGSFIDFKDLRLKTEKPFSKNSNSKKKEGLAYDLRKGANRTYINGFFRYKNSSGNKKIKKNILNLKNTLNIKNFNYLSEKDFNSKALKTTTNEHKYRLIKRKINNDNKRTLSESKDNISNLETKSIRKKRNSKRIKIDTKAATIGSEEQVNHLLKNSAPDFSKIISRDEREKAKGKKISSISIIKPNYYYVKERPIVMAVYKKDQTFNKYKKNEFKGIDSTFNYNPDSFIDKCNNHISPRVPNFNYMISRPYKKGSPLPSYMHHMHYRGSPYLITDKSLILNNYSEGKYIPASNSFFPKNSFNNIINVGYVHSNAFKEKNTDEDIQAKKKQIEKKISLSNINYEELINEGALKKFDNFNYKTITKEKKRNFSNNQLITFEEYDNENENK